MAEPPDPADHPIVLFDGLCNLCTRGVQFIIARDPRAQFRFASAQSDTGRALLRRHLGSDDPPGSLVLLDAEGAHLRSTASLRIAAKLPRPWCWFRVLLVLPTPVRDLLYRFIAANRFRLGGPRETCWVPNPDLTARFIP